MQGLSKKLKIWSVSGSVLLAAFLISCGTATNNNQGVTFNLLGFFAGSGEGSGCGTLPTGDLGQALTLDASTTDGSLRSSGVITFAGLENANIGTFIRVDRVYMNYNIEGASSQPPSTSLPFNLLLNAAGNTNTGPNNSNKNSGSSLPPGYTDGTAVCGFGEFFIVPPDIQQWIILNQGSLPEAPFLMTVEVYFTGITSAGDRFDSNTASYNVYVQAAPIISATPGSGDGSSSSSGAETF